MEGCKLIGRHPPEMVSQKPKLQKPPSFVCSAIRDLFMIGNMLSARGGPKV